MTRPIAALAAAAVILAGGPAGAGGGGRPTSAPTNMEMLETLARRVVDGSLDVAPVGAGDIVLVRHSEAHAAAWIVENYLAGRLAALGASVYVETAAPDTSKAALEATRGGPGAKRGPAESKATPAASADTTATQRGEAPVGEEDVPEREGPWPGSGEPEEQGSEADSSSVTPPPGRNEEKVRTRESRAGSAAAGGGAAGSVSGRGRAVSGGPGEAAFGGIPYVPAGDVPSPNKVLEFRIGELGVAYTRRWRKSLFGSAMVERAARAAILFRLLDGKDGRVLWTHSERLEDRNVVPQKLLAGLEDAPGQMGAKSAASGGIGRVVEPIVVSGIVVGLVFLFYSSRT